MEKPEPEQQHVTNDEQYEKNQNERDRDRQRGAVAIGETGRVEETGHAGAGDERGRRDQRRGVRGAHPHWRVHGVSRTPRLSPTR